jgi:hypothetical protein
MPRLLMNLRDVPDDEYAEVCAVLDDRGLQHYRIDPSRWGLHGGGVWLVDEARFDEARECLAAYQAQRQQRARAQRQAARDAGELPGLVEQLRRQPLRMLLQVLALIAALAISVLPFLWLMGLLPG